MSFYQMISVQCHVIIIVITLLNNVLTELLVKFVIFTFRGFHVYKFAVAGDCMLGHEAIIGACSDTFIRSYCTPTDINCMCTSHTCTLH